MVPAAARSADAAARFIWASQASPPPSGSLDTSTRVTGHNHAEIFRVRTQRTDGKVFRFLDVADNFILRNNPERTPHGRAQDGEKLHSGSSMIEQNSAEYAKSKGLDSHGYTAAGGVTSGSVCTEYPTCCVASLRPHNATSAAPPPPQTRRPRDAGSELVRTSVWRTPRHTRSDVNQTHSDRFSTS